MADIKFSALTDGGQPVATDRMPGVRAGANVKIAPAVPFGPYADLAALQTAFPASVALAGRVAYVGGAAPYAIYRCDGAAWADVNGTISAVAASRALTAADNGNTLECAAGVVLTVPAGLPANFGVAITVPAGTVTVTGATGVSINGTVAGSVTRAATNVMFAIARRVTTDSYNVTGN